jgi:hypothetical protein
MNTAPIVQKVWNFCTTLRDDVSATAIIWSRSHTSSSSRWRLAAYDYLSRQTLDRAQKQFLKEATFSGTRSSPTRAACA